MAREDWKKITLRIRPEIHYVLLKYSKGEYSVALRMLINRYAKSLIERAKAEGTWCGDEDGVEVDSILNEDPCSLQN